jgi:ATP-binding cassette subfamily B protein
MERTAAGFAWPVGRLPEAVEHLARLSGLASAAAIESGRAKRKRASKGDSADGGIEQLSRALEFEVESADVPYVQVDRTLMMTAPAILQIIVGEENRFLVLVRSSGATVRLLALDGRTYTRPLSLVSTWLRHHLESPLVEEMDRLLADAGVPQSRWLRARKALFSARLGTATASRCWMLRAAPTVALWRQMRHAGLPRRALSFIFAYAAIALASAGAWWLIGAAALEGRFDPGTLLAWSFLLLSLVPLGLFAMWVQGVFMIGLSGIVKMQLLAGALMLDPDETRHQGIGQHLARVLESASLESLALAGGLSAVTAVFDLTVVATILYVTDRSLTILLLFLLLVTTVGAGLLYLRARERWTASRLQITHGIVERMSGHRTRLVQENIGAGVGGHDEEDDALARYLELSTRMDRAGLLLSAIPRVWLLAGLAVMIPQFIRPDTTTVTLAAGLGATLLGASALAKAVSSLSSLTDAFVSYRQVRPLLVALHRREPQGHVDIAAQPITGRTPASAPLFSARDLSFAFRDRGSAVLKNCGFRIGTEDRIHLSGVSGGGKSTLVSMLTGLRVPDSGLLLLDGLDRATLGTKAWRRRVAAAPQFHENHLFADTLAFNLLMGRRWPPSQEDLRMAEAVCHRLGLSPLIKRMPAGLFQMVGESGWQLSHGERSRIFMARALLQGADLVVLDESFAELDPESLRECLPQASDLSKSLLIVAHA